MLTEKQIEAINSFVSKNYEIIDNNYIDDTNILYSFLKYGDIIELSGKRPDLYMLSNGHILPSDGMYMFLKRSPTMFSDSFSLKICKISSFFDLHPSQDLNNLFFELPFNLYDYYDCVKVRRFQPKNKIIGFMGAMQSGKTASAQIAKQLISSDKTIIISFADTLRDVCLSMIHKFISIEDVNSNNLTIEDLKSDYIKTRKITSISNDKRRLSVFDSGHLLNLLFSRPIRNLSLYPECANTDPRNIYPLFLKYLHEVEHAANYGNFTVRNLLQTFGTDFVRNNIDNDFWTNKTKSIIMKGLFESPDQELHYIIDDVRFENESDFVKSMNGIVIGIKRGDGTNFGSHPSERTMRDCWSIMASVTIHNDGDLTDLRRKINETLKELPGFIGA